MVVIPFSIPIFIFLLLQQLIQPSHSYNSEIVNSRNIKNSYRLYLKNIFTCSNYRIKVYQSAKSNSNNNSPPIIPYDQSENQNTHRQPISKKYSPYSSSSSSSSYSKAKKQQLQLQSQEISTSTENLSLLDYTYPQTSSSLSSTATSTSKSSETRINNNISNNRLQTSTYPDNNNNNNNNNIVPHISDEIWLQSLNEVSEELGDIPNQSPLIQSLHKTAISISTFIIIFLGIFSTSYFLFPGSFRLENTYKSLLGYHETMETLLMTEPEYSESGGVFYDEYDMYPLAKTSVSITTWGDKWESEVDARQKQTIRNSLSQYDEDEEEEEKKNSNDINNNNNNNSFYKKNDKNNNNHNDKNINTSNNNNNKEDGRRKRSANINTNINSMQNVQSSTSTVLQDI